MSMILTKFALFYSICLETLADLVRKIKIYNTYIL
jgi:hypothetical protein